MRANSIPARRLFHQRSGRFDMDNLGLILSDALIYASWLFIISLGLTLVFGVLRILNLAHGSLYALGAYVAASVTGWGVQSDFPSWLLVAALFAGAFGASVLIGPALERLVLARFYGRPEVTLLFVTYALLLILEAFLQAVWGVQPYYASEPYSAFGQVGVGATEYVGYDLFLVAVAVVVGLALHVVMTKTITGHLTVAVIQNPEISAAMGVRIDRIYVLMFTLGAFLAVLAGALTAPMIAIQPGLGINVVVASFAVVVIGGLGSIPGAAIGAILVSLARTTSVHVFPTFELFSVYLVMTLVLLAKPEGLFPYAAARRI